MTNTSFFDIPRRSSRCCEGDEILKQGDEYYSVLLQDSKTDKFFRKEFCLSCWNKSSQKNGSIHWKAKVPVKKKQEDSLEDKQLIVKLQEFAKSNTAEEKAKALALSLYLMRKKKVILRKEIERAGEETIFFEVPDSGETFKIKKVPLNQLQEAFLWLSTLHSDPCSKSK